MKAILLYIRDYLRVLRRIYFPRKYENPLQLILFITSKCNARCKHCFFWKDLNQDADLEFTQIKKISRELGKVFSLSISGGEPFLSSLLVDTCTLFAAQNKTKRIQIPTNGLDPERIIKATESILKQCACELTIALSIDGLKETHNQLRGRKDCFDQLGETYRGLVKLKSRYPRLRLVTNTVISRQNIDEIPLLFKWMRANWPSLDSVNWDWIRGDPREPELELPSLPQCARIKPILLSAKRFFLSKNTNRWQVALELAIRDYLFDVNLKTLTEKRQVIPCLAAKTGLTIYPSGDCSFCEILPPLGNLKKNTLPVLLSSPQAKQVRKNIKEKRCFCTHGCYQPYNVIFNPLNYPKIMKRLFLKPRSRQSLESSS